MTKKWLWAGIDMGVETTSLCIIDDTGEVLQEGVCPSSTTSVRHELARYRRSRYAAVAIEAGTGTHIVRGLRSLGYPVQLYETRQLSKFLRARRNKTDAGDARGMAEAGRIGASLISKVYLKSLESQALQARLTIRRNLIRQRIASVNVVSRQIVLFGGRLKWRQRNEGFAAAVDAEIRRLFRDRSSPLAADLRYLAAHCDRLIARQNAVDLELKEAAAGNEVCRRLMEIPGVGPLCALSFYAAVDDPHRFSRTTDIGSYFGLAPRLHESGLSARKARISKMGNKSVRSLLVCAAGMHVKCSRPDSALRDWTLRLEQRRGRAASRVALARKLAVIMLTLWKSGRRFDPKSCVPLSEMLTPVPQ